VKIFSALQIKEWDAFTIKNEPVASVELMERAAKACSNWILQNFNHTASLKIFCGKGNNGGDGLAMARILIENKLTARVYIAETNSAGSEDFQINEGVDKLISRIKNFQYDGGTQFGSLDLRKYDFDEALLFSDGLSTFGKQELIVASFPVIAITNPNKIKNPKM